VKINGKEKIAMDTSLTKLKDQDGAEYEVDLWVNGIGGNALGFFAQLARCMYCSML
jgi:hypothetical protein